MTRTAHSEFKTLAPPAPLTGTVHLVDDDEQFRTGLSLLLRSNGLTVETYCSAEHFLSVYRPKAVECLLVDLRMPGMNGLDLQRELLARYVATPLIIISAFAETTSVVKAVRGGAIDFIEKPIEETVLVAKVHAALELDRSDKQRRGNLTFRLSQLTEREREVLDLFVDAKTTVSVARILGISPKTVEKHRLKIFDKLDVASVPELIRLVLPQSRS
jgi:FixJ family two-component response regulator